jgi:hypothetical protein
MEPRRVRLGDVIDDYCPKCRLIMNHGVAGMVGDEVRKVRCNTCISEHVYKHGQLPKRRRNETNRLFNEVLRGMGRSGGEGDEPGTSEEEPEAEPQEAMAAQAEDEPALPAPERPAEQPPEHPDAATHGVRRKLYTIRRHSGGKAPGSGSRGA